MNTGSDLYLTASPQLVAGMWLGMMAIMMLPTTAPAAMRVPKKAPFVAGVMNYAAIAALALWITAEKFFSWGGALASAGGIALMGWGVVALLA